jgi:hypothetical protein
MVTHIALFKWKDSVPSQRIDEIMASIAALRERIPGIVELRSGVNFSPYGEGFTHAVVVSFNSRTELEVYRSHPIHVPVAAAVSEAFESSVGIDFEN